MIDLRSMVPRCRRGDALAWEALVRHFQSRIFALAFYYTRNREDARDLAQEIFVRVYQGLEHCRDDRAFTTWMLNLGRNCCVDWLRRQKARPAGHSDSPDAAEPVDDRPNPHHLIEGDARKRLLYRALEKLSLQSKEMILLKEIQGLKIREIADMLGIPPGTVKSRFGRARVELAKAVLKLDPSYGGRS